MLPESWGLAYGEALHLGGKKQKRDEERPSGQATYELKEEEGKSRGSEKKADV